MPALPFLLLLGLLPQSKGDEAPQGPQDGVFFLENVHLWHAEGAATGPHQMVVRRGVVESLSEAGQELPSPPEARRISAEDGWLLYPGAIHANFSDGAGEVQASPFQETPTDPRQDPLAGMEWGSRKDLRAWLYTADVAQWTPDKAEKWREAGFTSAYLLPSRGLLRGRAAWVSFNGHPLGQALLRRDGLPVLSLDTVSGGYPRTDMAALAVMRQVFYDLERYARLRHDSRVRFHADPDLEALISSAELPLLFHAQSAREIENVLDLLRDHAPGRRLVLLGGREAWKHAERLRATGSSVLYVLDLADAPKSEENAKAKPAEERPSWQEPARLREERRSEHARTVQAFRKLREQGVACALVPGAAPKDFADDLKQLAEDGLSAEVLWAATSSGVAQILGLPGAGEIAAGAAADFVIFRAPWEAGKARAAWLFADGRAWEFPKPPDQEKSEKEGGEEEKGELGDLAARFGGKWQLSVATPEGERDFSAEIDAAAKTVRLTSPMDPGQSLEGRELSFAENQMSFAFTVPELEVEARVELEVSGDTAEGRAVLPFGAFALEGTRAAAAPAEQEPEQEQKPEEGAAAEKPQGEKEEKAPKEPAPDLGHPEYPVETRADRRPLHELQGDVLLRGATLYPMTGVVPFTGDVLIQDGRIAGIGPRIETLVAVPTLDLSGMHLMPGIIDPHSHLALDAVNEGSVAITAECRIADVIHPGEVEIWRAAAGGCTVVQSLHGSANPIGGQAAVWELDYHRDRIAELLLPETKQGIKFALGENVKLSNSDNPGERFPNTRSGVQAVYRRAFTAARDYLAARRRHAEGAQPDFRRDARLEVLAAILENEIHVQCHSYRADELLMFLDVCAEFGVAAPTFQHVLEGYKVAPELAAAGAMASTFADWWAYKIEAYDAIPWNSYLLHKAGVVVTINSDSDEMIRRLNTEAGKSLLYGGLSYEDAMALCTRNAARQLHVDQRLGSLELGKDGTVSVFDAPPLSTRARCILSLARGRVLFEARPEHEERWRSYAEQVAAYAQARREAAAAANTAATTSAGSASTAAPAAPRPAGDGSRWGRNGRGWSYLIENAVVHPVIAEPFPGAVLLENGWITWVGRSWEGPPREDLIRVDAGGAHLYPGFINCGDVTGLYEIGSVRGTRDDQETGDYHPDLSFAAAVHADGSHPRVHRMTGITHVLVGGDGGVIAGQAALVQLDGETTGDMVTVPDLGLLLRFPRVARPEAGKEPEDPAELKELNRWFREALAYAERRDATAAAGQQLADQDPKLEALAPYAQGVKPILLQAQDDLTLARARRWAAERKLQVIYVGARDAWRVAGLLGADRARVIAGPVHALPGSEHDPYDAPYRNPGILAAAGCQVALRTADPEVTRNLPFQAATAAAHGWSESAALHALTLGAAQVLGIADYTGSIEVGKAGNLFLAAGDPLDFTGPVLRMWIGGREVELSSKQTELRERYEARIDRLAEAAGGR